MSERSYHKPACGVLSRACRAREKLLPHSGGCCYLEPDSVLGVDSFRPNKWNLGIRVNFAACPAQFACVRFFFLAGTRSLSPRCTRNRNHPASKLQSNQPLQTLAPTRRKLLRSEEHTS